VRTVAGRGAAQVSGNRPGTFAMELLNSLYELDAATIDALAKVNVA